MRLEIDHAELESIVAKVVAELNDQFGNDDRLAFDEAASAKLISVKKHVLRDARLKGLISPGKCGRSWLYSRRMLLAYIEQNMKGESE